MGNSDNQSFLEHLEDLRFVLLKTAAAFLLLFIPSWFASQFLVDKLLAYAAPEGFSLHYFTLLEPFFIRLKMSLALDLFLSLPFAFYFIWSFVAPALTERERRIFRYPFCAGILLALFGIVFAVAVIIPAVVKFSLSFAGPEMTPVIGIGSFISMALFSILACGLVFQFPLLIYALLTSGVIRVETVRKQRPVVIVVILIIAAVLTPPDVVSQVLLALPTWVLFELSLIFFQMTHKNPGGETEERSPAEPPERRNDT